MYRDLSQPIETGMQTFPDDPAVCLQPAATVDEDGYRVTKLHLGTHTGTHIDAPAHLIPDGDSLDAFPVERFVFEARVVDCTEFGLREPIPASALPADDDGDMVVCRTGWDAHWGTDRYLDHPYLSPGAAGRCVEAGWSVGLDTLNPDPTPNPDVVDTGSDGEPEGFPVHRALLGNGLFIVENLTNLAGLDRFRLFAFPLATVDADGSPVRAVARTGRFGAMSDVEEFRESRRNP